jgi:hypothetical protein
MGLTTVLFDLKRYLTMTTLSNRHLLTDTVVGQRLVMLALPFATEVLSILKVYFALLAIV